MDRHDVIVIGGGQSGLAAGYYLARTGKRFVILDGAERVGQSWRSRWDTLRLITPAPYNDLPGLAFPREAGLFPTKDQTADYLENYARTFALPVRLGTKVEALRRTPEGYRVEAGDAAFEAPSVIVATGAFQTPHIPFDRRGVGPDVHQIHSSKYKNPAQLPPGDALVVGCGNSGNAIARELSSSRRVYLSLGRTMVGPRRVLGRDVFWWLYTFGLMDVTVQSKLGQRLSKLPEGMIGVPPEQFAREYGITLVGRTLRAEGDELTFSDGRRARVRSIVWATGYANDYSWIDAPVFDAAGRPVHERGETASKGLYFLGLKWQYRNGSSLLGGVGRDAEYVVSRLSGASR